MYVSIWLLSTETEIIFTEVKNVYLNYIAHLFNQGQNPDKNKLKNDLQTHLIDMRQSKEVSITLENQNILH